MRISVPTTRYWLPRQVWCQHRTTGQEGWATYYSKLHLDLLAQALTGTRQPALCAPAGVWEGHDCSGYCPVAKGTLLAQGQFSQSLAYPAPHLSPQS